MRSDFIPSRGDALKAGAPGCHGDAGRAGG